MTGAILLESFEYFGLVFALEYDLVFLTFSRDFAFVLIPEVQIHHLNKLEALHSAALQYNKLIQLEAQLLFSLLLVRVFV